MNFVDFDSCHRMVYMRKLHSVTLTYFFVGKKFKKYIYIKRKEPRAKIRGRHLPSNGVIVKILLRDLDLLLEVTNLKKNDISEMLRVNAEMCGKHF